MKESYPIALALAGTPIPGKINPYLVLVSYEKPISVEVEVDEADTPRLRVEGLRLGWRFELPLKSFVDTISARLEQPLDVIVKLRVGRLSYPPPASVYAAVSLAIVRAVAEAGGYTMQPSEVLEAANSIDEEAGIGLDYIDALRVALTEGKSMAYRKGEEPVSLENSRLVRLELVGEEDIGEDYTQTLSDALLSAAARVAGVAVLETVQLVRSGDIATALKVSARIDNSLFYMLYSVNPPEEGCKWTPSLNRVYGVCLEGKGLGDVVEFTL